MDKTSMFKNPILNKLVHTNSMVAILFYVIISLAIVTYGFIRIELNVLFGLLLVVAGLLVFTLIEYLFHRYLYHSGDDYKDSKNWQYKVHGIHHVYPRDKDILAMPIPLAIVLASVFFFLFYFMMGELVYYFFPGFLTGYAGYLFVHYKVHTSPPPRNTFGYLWTHHHFHHYLYEDKAFGVSTPLWDHIFGTMPPKKGHKRPEGKV